MSNREQELAKAAKRSNFVASSDEKSWKEVQKSLKIAHEEAKKEKFTADIRDKMNQFESGKCDREMILSKEIEALRIESERSSLNARMEGTRKKIFVQQRSLPAVEEDKKNLSRMNSRKDTVDKVNGYSADLKVASDRKWYTLLMEENEELTSQLVKASQEADELKRKNEMLQMHDSNTVMQLQSSLSRLQITHRITKGALVEAQASIRTLRQEKKKNLVERQVSQEEQPSPVKDQSTDQENRWKQQKRELEKKIAFYVEKSEQYDEKIMDLNMTIGELVLKNEALEEQLASSKPEPTKSGSLDATAAENASAADDSGGSTTKIAKLQHRNETLKIQVDALMFEVESLREKQTYDYAVLQEKENELNNLQRETSEQKKLLKEWEEKEKASKHQEKWQETFNREHQTKIATLTAFYENSLEKVTKEKESLMLQVKLLKESTDKFRENDRKAVLCLGELNRRQKLIEMYHAQMDVLIAENTSLKTMLGDSRHDAKPLCFWDKLMELIMSIISDVVKGCVVVRQGDIQSVLEGLNELTKSLEKTELDLQFSQEANKNLLKEIEKIREQHRDEIEAIKAEKKNTEDYSKYKIQAEQLRVILTAKNEAYEILSLKCKGFEQRLKEVKRENDAHLNELEILRQQVTEMELVAQKERQERAQRATQEEKAIQVEDSTTDVIEELQLYKNLCDEFNVDVLTLEATVEAEKANARELNEKIRENAAKMEKMKEEIDLLTAQKAQMTEKYQKKMQNLMQVNELRAQELDHCRKKFLEEDQEIVLLKELNEKKTESIERLTSILREKLVEIKELRSMRNDDVTGEDPSPNRDITVRREKRKSDRQSLYDGNRSVQMKFE